MKKVISVFIILAFVGSMVVMTGCFGGSDGVLAGLAVFALAIVISGGTGAPAVFAANTRADIRYAISQAADKDKISVKIFPLKDGVEQGTGLDVPASQISWSEITAGSGNYQLKATPQISQADGYNEYRIKVYYNNNVILQGVKFLETAQKTGTQNVEVNPTSTAKALVYDNWLTTKTPAVKTYEAFEFNLGNTSVAAVQTQIETELTANTTAPDYSKPAVTNEVTPVATSVGTNPVIKYYTISGFITKVDMSGGQDDAMVTIYRKDPRQMINHVMTTAGNYTLTDIPDGTYVIVPTKQDHTYNPAEREVTVNGANQTGINFQAQSVFAPATR